jgi:hypothetical protein
MSLFKLALFLYPYLYLILPPTQRLSLNLKKHQVHLLIIYNFIINYWEIIHMQNV